jgi:hypothetical protein
MLSHLSYWKTHSWVLFRPLASRIHSSHKSWCELSEITWGQGVTSLRTLQHLALGVTLIWFMGNSLIPSLLSFPESQWATLLSPATIPLVWAHLSLSRRVLIHALSFSTSWLTMLADIFPITHVERLPSSSLYFRKIKFSSEMWNSLSSRPHVWRNHMESLSVNGIYVFHIKCPFGFVITIINDWLHIPNMEIVKHRQSPSYNGLT